MAILSVLRNNVYSKIGLDDTATGNEETLVTQWLNEGVREVLLRTHCFVRCIDMTLTASSWKYDLPASALAILKVVDSSNRPAEVVTVDDLLELRQADSNAASATPLRVAFMGSNLLLVWPTPSTADTIECFYVPKPTEMTDAGHDPSLSTYGGVPVEFHHGIELWALSQAADFGHEQRTQQGQLYAGQFEDYVRRVIRPAVNRKGGRLGAARVGRGRSRVQSGNGIYPSY